MTNTTAYPGSAERRYHVECRRHVSIKKSYFWFSSFPKCRERNKQQTMHYDMNTGFVGFNFNVFLVCKQQRLDFQTSIQVSFLSTRFCYIYYFPFFIFICATHTQIIDYLFLRVRRDGKVSRHGSHTQRRKHGLLKSK